MVNLADGDYELVPSDSVSAGNIDLNCANLNQEGKPRCIIPLFYRVNFVELFVYVVIILFAHLGF